MIKNVAVAAVCAVSASFASWDLFPVQEAGKGEARITYVNTWLDEGGYGTFSVGVRYSVIKNLELALTLPYQPYEFDGDGNFYSFADGIGNLTAMAKYQFLPKFSGFLDVVFPVGNEALVGDDEHFRFRFGAQYSQMFGIVNFGSGLSLGVETYGDDKITPPWCLNADAEADFLVDEMFVPHVRAVFAMELGRITWSDGRHTKPHTGHFAAVANVGSFINFTPSFSLDVFGDIQTQWHGDEFFDPVFMAGVKALYKF